MHKIIFLQFITFMRLFFLAIVHLVDEKAYLSMVVQQCAISKKS